MASSRTHILVVAAWLAIAAALPSFARAECCVCSGCPASGPSCFTTGGCDIGQCVDSCGRAGCSGNTFDGRVCIVIPACGLTVPAGSSALYLSLILVLITLGAFAVRRRSLPTPVRLAAAALTLMSMAAAIHAVTQVRLTGNWQLDSSAAAIAGDSKGQLQWNADVSVADDGSVSGSVALTGFPNVNVAKVAGTLRDGVVSGVLRDGDGPVIAEFNGTIEGSSLRGTFTKVDGGETGTFSWGVSAS
jgi:hypothetical protein